MPQVRITIDQGALAVLEEHRRGDCWKENAPVLTPAGWELWVDEDLYEVLAKGIGQGETVSDVIKRIGR